MSFTTRQLGANRVNHMPGTPVSCQVKNYTLTPFDGVIKGTDDIDDTQLLRCTDEGVLKVDIINKDNDGTILDVDFKNLDNAIKDISSDNSKFLIVGGKNTDGYDSLHLENNGDLKVSVSNIPDNVSVTTDISTALRDTLINENQVDNEQFLVMGGRSDNGEGETTTFKEFKVDESGVLEVVQTELDKAVHPKDTTDKNFLLIGGKKYSTTDDGETTETTETEEYNYLNVNNDGEITVNIKNGDISLGDISLDNTKTNPLFVSNDLLGKTIKPTGNENNKFLIIGGKVDQTTEFKEIKLDSEYNLSVIDENIIKASKFSTINNGDPTNDKRFIVIGGRSDDGTGDSDSTKFKELKVTDNGVLEITGTINIESDKLNDIASATVRQQDLGTPDTDRSHVSICASYDDTADGSNTSQKPIQSDENGILYVTTKQGKEVKITSEQLEKLVECIVDNDTIDATVENKPFLRIKNIDNGEGFIIRAIDVEGKGGANLSAIQGSVSNNDINQKVQAANRLITVDVGPKVLYFTEQSAPSISQLSGGAYSPITNTIGIQYPIEYRLQQIISASNNRPRINKIRISIKIKNNSSLGTSINDYFYIYGGINYNINEKIYEDGNRNIFPLEKVSYDDLEKSLIIENNIYYYYHSFVIDMPMGPQLGFYASTPLNNVSVGVAIIEF